MLPSRLAQQGEFRASQDMVPALGRDGPSSRMGYRITGADAGIMDHGDGDVVAWVTGSDAIKRTDTPFQRYRLLKVGLAEALGFIELDLVLDSDRYGTSGVP